MGEFVLVTCPRCDGAGGFGFEVCPECEGEGLVLVEDGEVSVKKEQDAKAA